MSRQQPGLGGYFNDCLASGIESLRLVAGIYETYRAFYRSLSKRLPFSIYATLSDDGVEIYAVLDARQDPRTIEAILESSRAKR